MNHTSLHSNMTTSTAPDSTANTSAAIHPAFTDDVVALPLVRRLAATLDRDPATLREGDALPRGWHVILFNVPTRQSQLRQDGAASLGVTLPDIGLPRLMLGGRQTRFFGLIPIGAHVRRETQQGGVQLKQGRSGKFALVKVKHSIFVGDSTQAAVVETQDYILREASLAVPAASAGIPALSSPPAVPAQHPTPNIAAKIATTSSSILVPDEALLFRYSAITDNPHRIHYDYGYATAAEGYPALVVNGSIPTMFLLELFRSSAGREPVALTSRNLAPMFCNRALRLNALQEETSWRLWAEDEDGNTTFDARVE